MSPGVIKDITRIALHYIASHCITPHRALPLLLLVVGVIASISRLHGLALCLSELLATSSTSNKSSTSSNWIVCYLFKRNKNKSTLARSLAIYCCWPGLTWQFCLVCNRRHHTHCIALRYITSHHVLSLLLLVPEGSASISCSHGLAVLCLSELLLVAVLSSPPPPATGRYVICSSATRKSQQLLTHSPSTTAGLVWQFCLSFCFAIKYNSPNCCCNSTSRSKQTTDLHGH